MYCELSDFSEGGKMSFSGTQQKCKACDKTVHFIEMLSADGVAYHKKCFKCSHCNGVLVVCYILYDVKVALVLFVSCCMIIMIL